MNFLDGWKTYLAAAGLFGLAVYQVSTEKYQDAMQTFLAALAAVGLRRAVAKIPDAADKAWFKSHFVSK